MTKQIEDYPELKAKFNETMVSDVSHFAVLCDPIKTRKLLTEQQARIDELTAERNKLAEYTRSSEVKNLKWLEGEVDRLTDQNKELQLAVNTADVYLNTNELTTISHGSVLHKEFKRLGNV